MFEGVAAYPLAWPSGRERTEAKARKPALFRSWGGEGTRAPVTLVDARNRLMHELDMLGQASEVVLSSNLELRLNGQLRADRRAPDDPGVALYFRLRGSAVVFACDKWDSAAGNVAAIAAHLDALRGQSRWGVGTLDQAFAGFVLLEAPWRAILGHPANLQEAEAAYMRGMKRDHPDAGGSDDAAATLNLAIAAARLALS